MRAGGAKAKGNLLENRIAKELSLWLTAQERADVLERSPASGAKFTTHAKRQRDYGNIAGDLIATDEQGYLLINRFVIEVKHRDEDGINAANLIFQTSNSGLVEFWRKLLTECQQTKKHPMLIFRQNNRPIMLCLSQQGIDLFQLKKLPHCAIKIDAMLMFVMSFENFLSTAQPQKLNVVNELDV